MLVQLKHIEPCQNPVQVTGLLRAGRQRPALHQWMSTSDWICHQSGGQDDNSLTLPRLPDAPAFYRNFPVCTNHDIINGIHGAATTFHNSMSCTAQVPGCGALPEPPSALAVLPTRTHKSGFPCALKAVTPLTREDCHRENSPHHDGRFEDLHRDRTGRSENFRKELSKKDLVIAGI